jgi:hypothetical protein
MDLMGLDEDKGKWLPFAFHLDIVVATKMTTDEEDQTAWGCTTVFTETGDSYIIDTPYEEFEEIFVSHYSSDSSTPNNREASL